MRLTSRIVDRTRGRITESFRMRFQKELHNLYQFRNALFADHKDAFNSLVSAWSNEQGAMTYANVIRALDLMLLTAVVDNRKQILKLSDKIHLMKTRVEKLQARLENSEPYL